MEKGAGGRSGRFCYLSTTEMLGTNFPLRLTPLGDGLSKPTFHSGTAGVHPANLANIHFYCSSLQYTTVLRNSRFLINFIIKSSLMAFIRYFSAIYNFSSSP